MMLAHDPISFPKPSPGVSVPRTFSADVLSLRDTTHRAAEAHRDMSAEFLRLLDERVVIFDGAMGTNIHRRDPKPADWGGEHLVNLSDAVTLTRPEWIVDIHREFLAVGCDAVETNTFNGSRHVLAEFGMAEKCRELSRRGAQLARKAVDEFNTRDR